MTVLLIGDSHTDGTPYLPQWSDSLGQQLRRQLGYQCRGWVPVTANTAGDPANLSQAPNYNGTSGVPGSIWQTPAQTVTWPAAVVPADTTVLYGGESWTDTATVTAGAVSTNSPTARSAPDAVPVTLGTVNPAPVVAAIGGPEGGAVLGLAEQCGTGGVYALGQSGATIADWAQWVIQPQVQGVLDFLPAPEHVVLEVGTNDVIEGSTTWESDLVQLIGRLRFRYPSAVLVAVPMPNPGAFDPELWTAVMSELVERTDAAVDTSGLPPAYRGPDGHHLTVEGTGWLASRIAAQVQPPVPPSAAVPGEWAVALEGVYLSGGDAQQAQLCPELQYRVEGCLTVPPDGLGLPDLRTEDVTYPQRDGVRHFSDWYEPRIITLDNVIVSADGCPGCPSVHEKVQRIISAWSRKCDDMELVVYTDCHGEGDRSVVGPFGVIGRPRAASVAWTKGRSKSARLTLRFDATDHRMYVLDDCGTPGSGTECVTLTPDAFELLRCYDRCYTDGDGTQWCYNRTPENPGGGPVGVMIAGTETTPAIITLCGTLTNPVVENLTTGEEVGIAGTIPGDECIIIDTARGVAETDDGADRTYLLTGNPRMQLQPGVNTLRLRSFASSDSGTAEVCWRPSVVTS